MPPESSWFHEFSIVIEGQRSTCRFNFNSSVALFCSWLSDNIISPRLLPLMSSACKPVSIVGLWHDYRGMARSLNTSTLYIPAYLQPRARQDNYPSHLFYWFSQISRAHNDPILVFTREIEQTFACSLFIIHIRFSHLYNRRNSTKYPISDNEWTWVVDGHVESHVMWYKGGGIWIEITTSAYLNEYILLKIHSIRCIFVQEWIIQPRSRWNTGRGCGRRMNFN